MFKDLVTIRLRSMFARSSGSGNGKKHKTRAIAFIALMIYCAGYFAFLFGMMFSQLCEAFMSAGLDWFYFAYVGILAFLLCFIGSVFVTQHQVYEAKDNELLMSMPVPPGYILGSRMVSILLLNYIYEIIVFIPAWFVYARTAEASVAGLIFFIAAAILLPLFGMTFSVAFGWITAAISSRTRRKNVFTLVITLILFFGYMYIIMRIQHYTQVLIMNGTEISAAIRKALPPFYYMGNSIANGSVVEFLIFALCCIIPFALVYMLLSRSFIKIATAKRGAKKVKYVEKSLKTSGIRKALIKKELAMFAGKPMYIFNEGIGLIFMLIAGIYIAVKHDSIAQLIGGGYIPALVCAVLGASAAFNIISAPSISLEAKTLWISQSSPLSEKDILLAKADMHILVTAPFIIVPAVIMGIACGLSPVEFAAAIMFPLAMTAFTALLGLDVNLTFPKLDWIDETAAMKQSMSVFITMMAAMAVVAAVFFIYMLILDASIPPMTYIYIVTALLLAAAMLLRINILRSGVARFRNLAS